MRFADKVAVVTGASRGIGRAVATALATEGARVVVNYATDQAAADEVVARVRAAGGTAVSICADVATADDVRELAAEAERQLGPVDVLVNNAGILLPGSLAEIPESEWDRVMAVNAKGVFLCCQTFGREMIARGGGGRIVNVASISGSMPEIHAGAYSPSKAAVISLTQLLAVEWAEHGIRVNAVCPGPVRTAMHEVEYADPELRAARLSAVPMKRAAEPDEVAKAVLFLASDDAGYVTGSCLTLDGGSLVSGFHNVRELKRKVGGPADSAP